MGFEVGRQLLISDEEMELQGELWSDSAVGVWHRAALVRGRGALGHYQVRPCVERFKAPHLVTQCFPGQGFIPQAQAPVCQDELPEDTVRLAILVPVD